MAYFRLLFPLLISLLFSGLAVLTYHSNVISASISIKRQTSLKFSTHHNRIAICMAGAARTFHYQGVHKNILKRVITPLQRQGYQLDLFFLFRMTDDPPPSILKAKPNKEMVYTAMELFNITQTLEYTGFENVRNNFEPYRFTDRSETRFASYRPPKWCGKKKKELVLHFSHTLYRTQHCLDVIAKYEQEHKFRYHWIYRLRPDVVFMGSDIPAPRVLSNDVLYTSAWSAMFVKQARLQLRQNGIHDTALFIHNNETGNEVQHCGIGDQFLLASREVAEVAFNAFDIRNDCSAYASPAINSEESLLLYVVKKGVRYAPLPVVWDIIRDFPDPFCNRMEYVTVPNTTIEERKKLCHEFWGENINVLPGHT